MRQLFTVAAVLPALVASTAFALPSLNIADLQSDSTTLQVVTDEASDLIQVAISGIWGGDSDGAPPADVLRLIDVAPSSPAWSPYATLNPFTGNETSGLYFPEGQFYFFASYEMSSVSPGAHDLFDLGVEGLYGVIGFTGAVVEDDSPTAGLGASIPGVVWEPPIFGDFEPDGDIDIIDFGILADAFGSELGDPNYDPRTDSEPDGDVDIIDFGAFADIFAPSVAIPEPATATTALAALLGVLPMRRWH